MSEQGFHFNNPPIVEAVIDIECDFAADFDLKSIEEPLGQAFLGTYPKAQTQLLQEFSFAMKTGEPVDQSARQALQAFRFMHDDGTQLVQARTTGYSFNRLAPYSSLDHYLPEIRRTWELYRAVAKPIQIRAVQLRYINRILLPMLATPKSYTLSSASKRSLMRRTSGMSTTRSATCCTSPVPEHESTCW